MKLQNLTVLFIIIMLPIILVLSLYISNSIKTVKFQSSYDEALLTAAHDAVYAFEKNSANEDLSRNPEIKRTLVKSSVEMFKTGLANSYGISNYSSEEVEEYVPAVVFGMHDGFYLYSPSGLFDGTSVKNYTHNLKNYVYYSETLEGKGADGSDITIMYSLDNYITVCGKFKDLDSDGQPDYEIKKGYLTVIDDGATTDTGDNYQGVHINNEDIDKDGSNGNENDEGKSYFALAFEFSHWFKNSGISWPAYLQISTGNDPEDETSAFVQHKREVIRNKIEGVLNSTITAYSKKIWSKNYKMPKLREEEWEKIYNNISMIGFFQGKELGLTEYNGYCVVNSTNSKEYVDSNLLYFIDNTNTYHDIRCTKLASATSITGYRIGKFESTREVINTNSTDPVTGNPIIVTTQETQYEHDALACYDCINASISSDKTIYDYIKPDGGTATSTVKEAYWTSLGRERFDGAEVTPIDITIDIRFDANGGVENPAGYLANYSTPNATITSYAYNQNIIFPVDPELHLSRDGYDFYGWSEDRTTLDTITSAVARFNKTYYASWKAKDYPVTFVWDADINGDGNIDDDDREVWSQSFNSTVNFSYNHTTKKPGKSFIGWSTTSGGTALTEAEKINCKVQMVDTDPLTDDANTYYAVWDDIEYEIKFMRNDGSVPPHDIYQQNMQLYHENVIFPTSNPVRSGYEFMGWSTDPSAFNKAEGTILVESNKTFYAYWGYKITFDYNDGTGYKQDSVYENGQQIVFPPNPGRVGYIFKGWSEDIDGATGIIDPTTVLTATAPKTYYAQWEIETFEIKFDANGGSELTGGYLATYNQSALPYGTTIQFPVDPSNNLEKTHFTFDGWSTDPNAASGIMNPSAIATANVTYYACWKIKQYEIRFNLNGGTGIDTSLYNKSYTAGATIVFPPTAPIKDHYDFTGWKRDDGTNVTNTSTEQALRDITFIAQWSPKIYTLTFEPENGGSSWTEQHTYNTVANFNISITNTGHRLQGWYVASNPSNVVTSAVVTGNATYYAKWIPNVYVITCNRQSGSGGTGEFYEKYGVGYFENIAATVARTTIDVPTRTGYEFGGYYTSTNGNGDQIIDSSGTIKVNSQYFTTDREIYAKWIPSIFKITCNTQPGSGGTFYEKYNEGFYSDSGATVGISKVHVPTRTGYEFGGYYTGTNGTGAQITDYRGNIRVDDTYFTSDKTIYAKWTASVYTITCDTQTGSGGTARFYEKYASGFYSNSTATTAITKINIPTKAGHDFGGYYTEPNGAGNKVIKENGDINVSNTFFTENKTIYAKWTIQSYPVKFYQNHNSTDNTVVSSQTVTYGNQIALPGQPTRPTGYTFAGWGTTRNASSTQPEGTLVTITGPTNFYAIWTKIPAPSFDTDQVVVRITVSYDRKGYGAINGNGTKMSHIRYVGFNLTVHIDDGLNGATSYTVRLIDAGNTDGSIFNPDFEEPSMNNTWGIHTINSNTGHTTFTARNGYQECSWGESYHRYKLQIQAHNEGGSSTNLERDFWVGVKYSKNQVVLHEIAFNKIKNGKNQINVYFPQN